jgi:hypothetical protein
MQDDPIRIIDSSSAHLREYAARRRRIVFHSFHRLVQSDPSMSVVYERGGRRFHVPRVADDPVLARPVNPLLAKTFHFRMVRPTCGH